MPPRLSYPSNRLRLLIQRIDPWLEINGRRAMSAKGQKQTALVELIFRARFSTALRAACPIYVVFLATIAFAIHFPEVVLWLPKQVLPASVGCFPNPDGPGLICPQG